MQYTSDHYIQITKAVLQPKELNGHSTMCKCPYHKDKTPSLSVSIIDGRYKCFSCGKSGHISQLIKDKFGRTIASILKLEEDEFKSFGIPKPITPTFYSTSEKDINVKISGNKTPIFKSKKVLDYLEFRGVSPVIAQDSNMFYLEEGWINGTFIQQRICTPVVYENKLLTVDCRDISGKADPKKKCIYPKDTIKPLFGFDDLDLTQPVFLFEGLLKMMVARSDRYFYNSTTAFGSKLSRYQLTILNRIPILIVVPDSDEAGLEMVRLIKKEYKGNLSILEMRSSLIKDCDEIITKLHMSVKDFRMNGGFLLKEGMYVRA